MIKNFILVVLIVLSNAAFAQKDNGKYFDIMKMSDIYNAIWRELDINYVDTLNYTQLNNIAIGSMLQSLDLYTIYIPEQQEEALKQITTGNYGGIGAMVQKRDDYVMITDPKFGMPAQKNGLIAGDQIVEIDSENMRNKSSEYVSSKLKGIPGTEIKLKVRRYNDNKLIEKKFIRESIHINSIEYYSVLSNNTGYIQLNDFTDNSFTDFKAALTDLYENKQINKLIIDLRDNGGGLVNEAVSISSLFLPKNTKIVSMKGKSLKSEKNYKTPFMPVLVDIPIVFLINENSASASEILAGTFQDLDRAVIVGEQSFGKGLVQSIKSLPYGGYLKVTTAKYYLPSGRCIQRIDYSQDNERPKAVPDSLTSSFKTSKGRIVRDKSGIMPDVPVMNEEGNYISYYLYVQNVMFDYATKYYQSHQQIAEPQKFNLTDDDYMDFIKFVKVRGFSYQPESEKALQQLIKVVEAEGYDERTKDVFDKLENILKPDLDKDLLEFRKDIQQYLEDEIVKRYYYQKGSMEYRLRGDKWVQKGLEILNDQQKYDEILKIQNI
jgi:carboxyl-terminal processing protease